MSDAYTVSDYLLQRLTEIGVDRIFGVPGDFVFPLLDTIERRDDVGWVGCANELNSGYAADAYARVRGLGVVIGSCGVLELGAAGAIGGAFAEEVPLLVIGGLPPEREMAEGGLTHHSLRGRYDAYPTILESITVARFRATASNACSTIDAAIRACRAASGPVHLGLPQDVQALPAARPDAPLPPASDPSDPGALAEALDRAEALLRGAARPAILVDYAASRYALTAPVEALSTVAGIPFATTRVGRSSAIDQTAAGYLGSYVASSVPTAVSERLEEADVLVRVCLRRDETNRGVADPARSSPGHIDVESDSVSIGGARPQAVRGVDVLRGLAERMAGAHELPVTVTHPVAEFVPDAEARVTQDRLLEALTGFVRPDDTIVLDFGTCQWVADLTLPVRTRLISQTKWSAIGYSVPAVVGVGMAEPGRRILHIVGDGAFQETAQEVSTIVRHKIAPITIVFDNAQYAIENATHGHAPVDFAYNRLPSWRYQDLPAAFGGVDASSAVVETEQELARALDLADTAQRSGRYSLISVRLDPTDIAAPLRAVLSGYMASKSEPGAPRAGVRPR